MPVIAHDIHESTRIGAEYRYGCWNKPRPVEGQMVHSAQNKYPFRHSTECRFDMSLSDPACTGCEWRGSGESYDQSVRKEGK